MSACQCSDHTPHTQVGLHGRRPRMNPLLKLAHKKACKQFAEDNLAKSMNYWKHVLWSDESKVNLFDSGDVQHVWRRPGDIDIYIYIYSLLYMFVKWYSFFFFFFFL